MELVVLFREVELLSNVSFICIVILFEIPQGVRTVSQFLVTNFLLAPVEGTDKYSPTIC